MSPRTAVKLVVIFLLALSAGMAAGQGSGGIQYFYDDLGRLTTVIDPSGNVATYSYDAVGNILKITRSSVPSTSTVAVFSFAPQQGPVGTSVTILGQGFSGTASQNTVQFNGAAASIQSATPTRLVAIVPAGATTGPISVSANAQTAVSTASFIVLQAPGITSISPNFALESQSSSAEVSLSVSGANLAGTSFAFQPSNGLNVSSAVVNAAGTSASLSVTIAPNTSGPFVLVATGSAGSSSVSPSSANTLHVLDPNGDDDHDGLTNAVELALGTNPLNPSTIGDGITDGWKVFYGFNPLDPSVANQDNDGDGLTNLQEFQQGFSPRDPDRVAPGVAQVSPAANATNVPTNGRIVVRFGEPLLTGVPLAAAQTAIQAAVPSLSPATLSAAAQTLQSYLQGSCCGNSVISGVVTVLQGTTPVTGSVQVSNDGLSITFAPAPPLTASTAYTVQANGVRDLAGNRMTQQFQSGFTTGTTADTTAPFIVRTSPASGDTNVPTNAAITLQFSKPVDPATLSLQTFAITGTGSGVNVTGAVQVDASGLTAAFIPNPPLGAGLQFTVAPSASIKDTAGNGLAGLTTQFSFTTTFTPENAAPSLVGSSPANGATSIPTNSLIVLEFSEPMNFISALGGIQVSAGGQPVAGSFALSDADRRITFTPAAALVANTTHTITLTAALTDMADHPLSNPGSFSFQTGSATDTSTPTVTAMSPPGGAVNLPVNTVVQVQFSKAIDPLTVTSATLQVTPTFGIIPIAGAVTVSIDGTSATFTPSAPLLSETSYIAAVNSGISDLQGNVVPAFSDSFTTGVATQTAGPVVLQISPQNGEANIPVNPLVVVKLNEPVEPASVGSNAIVLATGGVAVPGSISTTSDRLRLFFRPTSLLAVSTAYTVTVAGFSDVAGNPVTPFTSTFTTSASSQPDTDKPQVLSVSPANAATGVPVNTQVVLTFNELIDVTSVSSDTVQVQVAGLPGSVAGTYTVNNAVVTFTPLSPLPANANIQVTVTSVEDVAWAGGPPPPPPTNLFTSSFSTGAGTDTNAPTLLSVTPNSGSANIGLNAAPVLIFSKSLNPATVNSNTLGLLAGSGVPLQTKISISSDNRTVTLNPLGLLPGSSVVTVVATSGVQDFFGNALADFRSQFTTAPAFDITHAAVLSQRPGNGATGVPVNAPVVLFVNEPLNASTVSTALHVSQNGVLVQGTVTVRDNGQTIEFVPSAGFQTNSLVQIFLDNTALDTDANPVLSYQGSFLTVVNTGLAPPAVVNVSPPGLNDGFVPLNAIAEVQYNQPLNPATVNTNTVNLQGGGQFVPGPITLDPTGTVIRIAPSAPLAAGTSYHINTTTGITGVNGVGQAANFNGLGNVFTTGTAVDNAAPVVTLVSPPDGSVNVPVNAVIRVAFNKSIDELSINAGTIQVSGSGQSSIPTSFIFDLNGNRDVLLIPQAPLPDNTQMTITVTGVNDLAGNLVVAKTTRFTTSSSVAGTAPVAVSVSPFNGAIGVPLNALITLQSNVPVDPATLADLVVRDGTVPVAGTYSTSADGRTVTFLPSAPLAVEHHYNVLFNHQGLTDLAENLLTCSSTANAPCDFSFTAAASTDTTTPAVVGVNPSNQATAVPVNAQVLIQFSKPIDQLTLNQVTLSSAGGQVNTVPVLSNGQQTLTLVPVVPLSSSTQYTVNIAGVQDLSGNALASPVVTTFTTSGQVDLLQPSVVTVSPAASATGVPFNAVAQVQFNKAIDPLTVTTATLQLVPAGANPIPGTVSVASDGKSATFTPTSPLASETKYTVQVSNGIADVTGRGLQFFASSFTTGVATQATGPQVVTVSPANSSSGVPLNAHVDVVLNEPVEPISVGSNAITLAAGGVNVAGSITVSGDHTGLKFVPSSSLAANTSYTVTVSGFTDVAGNAAVAFSSTFTTGSAASTAGPQVSAVSPPNAATGIAVTTAVALTFNEAVDTASVNTNTITVSLPGLHAALAGSYVVNGSSVTFTPTTPLPANANIQVQVAGVLDLAGNTGTSFSSSFTTTGTVDTTPPTVVSITPNNGATNIGLNAVVVLTFSKSLNPATVNSNSLGVLGGSEVPLPISVAISSDNRSVTLTTGTLPASSVVTVVANGTISDLSGNGLAPFRSQFTTSAGFDTAHAAVVSQRPANGATGVPINSQVVLFVNEALNAQSVSNGLHVSQNGVLVNGTIQVSSNGQTITFQPGAPFANNATVQVFLDSTVLDADGSPVSSYQGSFQTVISTATVLPALTSSSPVSGASAVPLNVVPELMFNEPLDPTTVNTNTILLENQSGQFLAGTVKLDTTQQLITFQPSAPLAASVLFDLQAQGVRGTNGLGPVGGIIVTFTTGGASDNVNPAVTLVAPQDGTLNVPVNARVHIRFSKPINPLSVNGSTISIVDPNNHAIGSSFSFSNSNQDVLVTPNTVLPSSATMAITVSGVQDMSANANATQTTHFTTGAVPTTVTPIAVNSNPFNGATGVSVNTAITLQTNVPVDPGSVNSTTFQLQDSTAQQAVAGAYSVSASGQTVSFVPGAALATSKTYNVLFNGRGVTDLAGNSLTCSFSVCDFSFTTAATANTTGPTVVGVSPLNGFTQAPINAQVVMQFSEPVDSLTLNQITLSSSGGPVTVSQQLSGGNQTLILNPLQPLTGATSYTLTVAGVQDLSGNVISPAFTSSFTTGSGADLTPPPAVTAVAPFNGAEVPTNASVQLQFSKVVDALTVNGATFQLSPKTNGVTGSPVAASISVAGGTSATLTPSASLAPSTTYVVQATTGITDLIGQPLSAFSSTFVTATGSSALAVVAVSPPNQSSGVAVNAHVDVLLNSSANAATIGSNSIVVSANGSSVPGTVTANANTTLLTFKPASLLAVSTTYAVTVSGFADPSGNQVVPFSSSFTTGASGTPDTTPPAVNSISPPNGATNVPVTTSVVLTFSKTIDPTSVNGTTIAIVDSFGEVVTGNYAVSGNVVTFTVPGSFSTFAPQINVQVSNVLDLAGNPNVPFTSSFTTTSSVSKLFPYPGRRNDGELALCTPSRESQLMVPVVWTEKDDAGLLQVLETPWTPPGSSTQFFLRKVLPGGLGCSLESEKRAAQQFVTEDAATRPEKDRPSGDQQALPGRSALKETGGDLR